MKHELLMTEERQNMIDYLTNNPVLSEINKFCEDKSYKDAAEQIGISPQYLSDILLGKRAISESIARYFGYKKIIAYIKEDQ